MLRNFFKTAGRNILRHKAYSIINFIGLTCGVSLALLIMVYVRSEINFDTFHEKADRLYRIKYVAPNGLELASSPPPLAVYMPEYFPEVELTARVYGRNVSIKRPDVEESFEETGVFFADSSIMKMMTFEFVKGDREKALQEEFTVVINEEMATKYFGDKDPIGETLVFAGKHSFRVTAVVKDFPQNSHINFNMLVPRENMFDMENDETAARLRANLAQNFVISHSYTYVLLREGADPANVDKNMDAFMKKFAPPQLQVGQVFTLFLVRDIHMNSTMLAESNGTNSWTNIFLFAGVGLLTIIIACINYINLSTAQSFTRIKEIGIRKILGSFKYQIIFQFLAESFLFCLISFVLSYGVFYLSLPSLNTLMGTELLFNEVVDFQLVAASIGLLLLITLLAGGYPSYFVTKFESVNTLKGNGSAAVGGQWLRKTLIVFQLGIACMLLSGSLLIVKQLDFLSSRPLGFKKDHIVTVPIFSQNLNGIFSRPDSTFRIRLKSFRDGIESQTGVMGTTLSSNVPGLGVVFRGTVPEGFSQEDNMFIANISCDYDFFKAYDIEFVAGRPFSQEFTTDPTDAFIVNETAVRDFKWETPEKAIGKTINREGKIGKVVGVIKDINFTSLTSAISPLVMEYNRDQMTQMSIRFENNNVEATLDKIEDTWNAMFPEKSFQYNFLDQQLDQQYRNFQNFGTIIQTFTFIAILIACLGVYGLVLFVVQRKVKEIGVRKVLGASAGSILNLIYRDFALLIVFAFVFATPIAWYFMDQWLANFTYHTTIDVWTFGLSLVLVMFVTSLTIAYQALKASLANPVKSLRTE
ncbi:MAG TPA: ABC transporter permease [Cyclobacteriaceae bacterium]|nr:ABC transporter permease [Cyclobacteriaceae bacterium]